MAPPRPSRNQSGAAAAVLTAIGAGALAGLRARRRRPPAVVPAVAQTESEPAAPPPEPPPPRLPLALPRDEGPSAPAASQAGLSMGVGDVYREARRAFGRAATEPGDETFAELQARSLALWYALSFGEPFAGRQTKRLARETRRLVNLLREHAELTALLATARDAQPPLVPSALDRLDAFGAKRRARLERRVAERGRALFETKPTRLARRLADEQASD